MRISGIILAVALALCSTACEAQSTLLQGGPWTGGHAPMYVSNGTSGQPILQDSGPAGGGKAGLGMSEGLFVARGTGTPPYASQGTGPLGTNWCDYDAPITNATGYHYLCLSANAQGGGLITYGRGGTASTLPLAFTVNGTTYQFPFVIGGIVGPSSSTVGHIATWNNTAGTLLADGGISLPSSLTSGGVLYNSSSSAVQSSGALTAGAIVLGAGAGAAPTSAGLGTTTTVYHGNAAGAGSFGSVVTGDVVANAITNAKLAQMAAGTLKGNATGSLADPTDLTAKQVNTLLGAATWAAGPTSGSANAQTISLSPAVTSLSDLIGVRIGFVTGFTNTATATLAVNGLTATTIKKPASGGLVSLSGGELVASNPTWVTYDGTEFVLLSPFGGGSGTNVYCAAGFDSTSNIQAAINGAPSGGTVLIPATTSGCTISGSLTITKPLNIQGQGNGASFVGTLNSSTDVFHVAIPAATVIRGISFDNFAISISGGRAGINFDTTASNTSEVAEVSVTHVDMSVATTLAVAGILINNPVGNTNGGTFNAYFGRNVLVASASGFGIEILNGGDSIHVDGGIISGTGTGILVQQIPGAGNFVMDGAINISAAGGVDVTCAIAPILKDFEIESGNPTVTGSLIKFDGTTCSISYGIIGPGQIQILPAATGYSNAIQISTADHSSMDNVRIASGAVVAAGILVTGAATNTVRGPNIIPVGFTAAFTNAGTGTIHVTTAAGP